MKIKYFKNEKKMLAYIDEHALNVLAVYSYKDYICVITIGDEK